MNAQHVDLILKAARHAIRAEGLPRTRLFPIRETKVGSYCIEADNRHGVGTFAFVPKDADFSLSIRAFAERYIRPEIGWEFCPPGHPRRPKGKRPNSAAGRAALAEMAELSAAIGKALRDELRSRADRDLDPVQHGRNPVR